MSLPLVNIRFFLCVCVCVLRGAAELELHMEVPCICCLLSFPPLEKDNNIPLVLISSGT